MAGTLEREHESAGEHGRWNAVGLPPVPGLTQKHGQPETAGVGMACDRVTDERDVLRADGAASVFEVGIVQKRARSLILKIPTHYPLRTMFEEARWGVLGAAAKI